MNAIELRPIIDRVAKLADMSMDDLRRAASVDASSRVSMKAEFAGFTRGDLIRAILEHDYLGPDEPEP